MRTQKDFSVDYEMIDEVEAELLRVFRKFFYDPIIKILKGKKVTKNDLPKALEDAISNGQITYWRDRFIGKFSATTSRELKRLGAKWDTKSASFKLSEAAMPQELKAIVKASNMAMLKKLKEADNFLKSFSGKTVAEQFKGQALFSKAITRGELELKDILKAVAIKPQFSKFVKSKVAKDWEKNMDFFIVSWADEEIKKFRADIQGIIISGKRYGSWDKPGQIDTYIFEKYGEKMSSYLAPGKQFEQLTGKELERVQKKAAFLARNETRLMMTTYKYSKAQEAGSEYFQWRCVKGTPNHPVRPSHIILDNKVYRWDEPPLDFQLNKHILPGGAYNCRCTAKALFNFQIEKDKKGNPVRYADGSYKIAKLSWQNGNDSFFSLLC